MILSDIDIKQFMFTKDIIISNFSDKLEPASYDMKVGAEGITEAGLFNIEKEYNVKIPRGSTIVIYPHEEIKISNKIAARYGLRSQFARKGLILLSGPQIDPGFEGTLSVTLYNAGTSDVVLSYLDEFITVEFFLLKTPASKGYSGRYQKQKRITSEEIELLTRKYKNIAEIEEAVTKFDIDLSSVKYIVTIVLLGVIAGIVSGFVVKYL